VRTGPGKKARDLLHELLLPQTLLCSMLDQGGTDDDLAVRGELECIADQIGANLTQAPYAPQRF
jgi:hypothetical protein